MSLLTDDEKHDICRLHQGGADWSDDDYDSAMSFAEKVEAAILAKLASAELPVPSVIGKHKTSGLSETGYTADQLRQAFAQGAASQLAEKPDAFAYMTNGWRWCFSQGKPPDDAYDEGTLIELFTRKEPK